ncbi:TetR/AcrR family transcriptional regulator [Isoptericola croceus]|uniref:TetR/AcrR family transcriptional regulator n=1 Tax=Isoptericola croceus TaxID=3031406 RepID=UPI0023F76D70|nr:TetR/AcrR family transcriptional regulator [Isoptericola croceus]
MTRIVEPRNRRSRDTRAAILDAAWRLLQTEGGAGLSMSAVAQTSGVSRRGLYLHFASRGQLFIDLFAHINERLDLHASLDPMIEASSAVDALDAWARHAAGYQSRLIGVVRAVDRARGADLDAEALWQQAMADWHHLCLALAGRLADEGMLSDPWTIATAADLLWSLMSVELIDDLMTEQGWSSEELAERLRVLVRRTLIAPAGDRPDVP